jgi:hypothetical protein
MGKTVLALILCCTIGIVFAAPNNGNGNKEVFEWDMDWTVDCDGSELLAELSGWSQFKAFKGNKNRNISLEVFHVDTVYTNDVGDTWVWRDRGPDHYYVVTNELGEPEVHWAITGRSGWNVIGHVVINMATGELVVSAGQHPFGGDDSNFMAFWADDLACEILY